MQDNRIDRLVNKALEHKTSTCGCYRCNHRVAMEKATRIVRGNGRVAYLCDSCRSKKTKPVRPAKATKAGAQ